MIRTVVSANSSTGFRIAIRDHELLVDQPTDHGGADAGPTPTELLLASLASCIAHYARGYLERHDLPTEGLHVEASARIVQQPARLDDINVALHLPDDLSAERRDALLLVASKCTVHNTLRGNPQIQVLDAEPLAPALRPVDVIAS